MTIALLRKRFATWLRNKADRIYPDPWQDHWPGIVRESTFTLMPEPKTTVRVELHNGEHYHGEVHLVMPTWIPKPPSKPPGTIMRKRTG